VIIDRDGEVLLLGNSPASVEHANATTRVESHHVRQPALAHRLSGGHRRVKPKPSRMLTSVIVPCFDQLEFTRHCLQSLFRHTRREWELIIIDNGSTDDTAAYLAGVEDAAAVPVTIIRNPTNRGFPAAINQGLEEARGEYLVMLNNDAVVTDDWLDQLIALAGAATEKLIGLVGPMSNYATTPQLVEDVPYRDLEAMHLFAQRWRDEHRGKWFTVPKLSGFCVLMKREVYEKVGGLDERFGLGFFDDDDLAERSRRAGYSLAVARDLFIHHFGSRSFIGNGIEAGKLLEENAQRFAEKWGTETPQGKRVELRAWRPQGVTAAAGNAVRSIKGSCPMVSLTMIVRDEEHNLPHCLGSVRGIFDEIVVVDTGSKDRTVEIVREFGAKVFHFNWIDDFSAARNVALSHATGDYAFWLDGDDLVEPVEQEELRGLIERLKHGDDAAYVVRCACDPSPDGGGGDTVVDHIRLFPLMPNVCWTYRVHEQILPSLRRANIPVRWTDLTVRHTGYVDPAVRSRKLDRDSRILQAELSERPDDPFILFNLGSIAIEQKDWACALGYLQNSLAGSAANDSITRKLYALIARAHQMMGNAGEAIRVCCAGLEVDPQDAELWFRKAVLHRHQAEPAEAEACWRRILTLRRPEKFASVDMGIYGHLTRRNLAALAAERGDREEEARLWSAVLVECPGDREAKNRLKSLKLEVPTVVH
jgi:glycosyltransferase involved in cell wall biosynthesis